MWFLFLQIWIWVIGAFIFGWLAHWFFCCRNKDDVEQVSADTSDSKAEAIPTVIPAATPEVDDSWKPKGFASAPADVDDLKRIKGVGSVIEETLNGLGVYQFTQIAEWSNDNVSWVENFLAFPGRISREDWIEQSKTLDGGGTTEFANRVDKGDIDYS